MGSSGALFFLLKSTITDADVATKKGLTCEKKDVTGRSRGTKSNSLAVLRTKLIFKPCEIEVWTAMKDLSPDSSPGTSIPELI